MTTSRWISRFDENASVSMVALTVPSMLFSMAAKPKSNSAASTAFSTAGMDVKSLRSHSARSGSDSTACSVNVPCGPRYPMVRLDEVTAQW